MSIEPLTPRNSEPLRELHQFVGDWSRRHGLDATQEAHLLATYLAGRLDVATSLNRIKALPDAYPATDFGELKGSPVDELPPLPGMGELKGSPLDEIAPRGKRCPKCDGSTMRHERLRGYRCVRCG